MIKCVKKCMGMVFEILGQANVTTWLLSICQLGLYRVSNITCKIDFQNREWLLLGTRHVLLSKMTLCDILLTGRSMQDHHQKSPEFPKSWIEHCAEVFGSYFKLESTERSYQGLRMCWFLTPREHFSTLFVFHRNTAHWHVRLMLMQVTSKCSFHLRTVMLLLTIMDSLKKTIKAIDIWRVQPGQLYKYQLLLN